MTDQIRAGLMDGLGFRFQIGDVCCHRGAVEPRIDCYGHEPVRVVVLGRMAEQCAGGVQLHYYVQAVHADGSYAAPGWVSETALAPYPPPREPPGPAEGLREARPRARPTKE